MEFRHASWHSEEVFGLLERYGVAYFVMRGAHLPCMLRAELRLCADARTGYQLSVWWLLFR